MWQKFLKAIRERRKRIQEQKLLEIQIEHFIKHDQEMREWAEEQEAIMDREIQAHLQEQHEERKRYDEEVAREIMNWDQLTQ